MINRPQTQRRRKKPKKKQQQNTQICIQNQRLTH